MGEIQIDSMKSYTIRSVLQVECWASSQLMVSSGKSVPVWRGQRLICQHCMAVRGIDSWNCLPFSFIRLDFPPFLVLLLAVWEAIRWTPHQFFWHSQNEKKWKLFAELANFTKLFYWIKIKCLHKSWGKNGMFGASADGIPWKINQV